MVYSKRYLYYYKINKETFCFYLNHYNTVKPIPIKTNDIPIVVLAVNLSLLINIPEAVVTTKVKQLTNGWPLKFLNKIHLIAHVYYSKLLNQSVCKRTIVIPINWRRQKGHTMGYSANHRFQFGRFFITRIFICWGLFIRELVVPK